MGAYNFIDITGKTFGRLTVIEQAPRLNPKITRWLCVCECGKRTVVVGQSLRHGQTKSCGCLLGESVRKRFTTHGMAKSAEYTAWSDMKRRCHNKNSKRYHDYGGRGIFVCASWLHSFQNFLADMGVRPSEKHSIERLDPNKGYEPSNCTWLLMSEQARNRRDTLRLTAKGETKSVVEWAEITGITHSTIRSRHDRGWDDEKIIATPLMANRRNKRAS